MSFTALQLPGDHNKSARKRCSTVTGLVSPLFELAKHIAPVAVIIVSLILIRGSG